MVNRNFRQGIPVRRRASAIAFRILLMLILLGFISSVAYVAFVDPKSPIEAIEQVIELS